MKSKNAIQDAVVALAAMKYRLFWKSGSDISTQTKSSIKVGCEWQIAVNDNFKERFSLEYPVGEGFKEKIDMVDLQDAVAYEMKVSENNTHFEFYRNIFKVAVHNAHNPRWKIKKLVFITPDAGAAKLNTDFGNAVRALAGEKHSIEVEICGI